MSLSALKTSLICNNGANCDKLEADVENWDILVMKLGQTGINWAVWSLRTSLML